MLEGGNGNDYLEDNLGRTVFLGGGGNDYIQAANNGIRDEIDCGPGDRPRRRRPDSIPSSAAKMCVAE